MVWLAHSFEYLEDKCKCAARPSKIYSHPRTLRDVCYSTVDDNELREVVSVRTRTTCWRLLQVIVTHTPKTLREILPTLFELLLGCLASHSDDKRTVSEAKHIVYHCCNSTRNKIMLSTRIVHTIH